MDLPLVHEWCPAVDRGHTDVEDHLREGRVLLRGQDDQHGGCVAVIRQLHHLVFQALGRVGLAWGGTTMLMISPRSQDNIWSYTVAVMTLK